jgi:hypothetical protein
VRGFARVCEGVRGCARVCEGVRGCAWSDASSPRTAKLPTATWLAAKINVEGGLRSHLEPSRTFENLSEPTQQATNHARRRGRPQVGTWRPIEFKSPFCYLTGGEPRVTCSPISPEPTRLRQVRSRNVNVFFILLLDLEVKLILPEKHAKSVGNWSYLPPEF